MIQPSAFQTSSGSPRHGVHTHNHCVSKYRRTHTVSEHPFLSRYSLVPICLSEDNIGGAKETGGVNGDSLTKAKENKKTYNITNPPSFQQSHVLPPMSTHTHTSSCAYILYSFLSFFIPLFLSFHSFVRSFATPLCVSPSAVINGSTSQSVPQIRRAGTLSRRSGRSLLCTAWSSRPPWASAGRSSAPQRSLSGYACSRGCGRTERYR